MTDTLWGITGRVCRWRRDFNLRGKHHRYWEYIGDNLRIGMCFQLTRKQFINDYGDGYVGFYFADRRYKIRVERMPDSTELALVGHWLSEPMSDAEMVELKLLLSEVETS